ncbi:hypothetical protein [Streptomyces rhizosphaerihabitans]|uniref:hypothetical protein n=1 Tax=Streptomyces rhizosphaerihabitans TaxID=1266770 RepID=UPI0021C1A7AD|nr:hypothetical protein [Streptomyces rhizosphaerihabitans]MCT9004641.1 hypothetical protein [Streptomyces rhizosphaerihabitans]
MITMKRHLAALAFAGVLALGVAAGPSAADEPPAAGGQPVLTELSNTLRHLNCEVGATSTLGERLLECEGGKWAVKDCGKRKIATLIGGVGKCTARYASAF